MQVCRSKMATLARQSEQVWARASERGQRRSVVVIMQRVKKTNAKSFCVWARKCVSGGPNKNKSAKQKWFSFCFSLCSYCCWLVGFFAFPTTWQVQRAPNCTFLCMGRQCIVKLFRLCLYGCAFVLSLQHFCHCDRVGAATLCVCICVCVFERAIQNAINTDGAHAGYQLNHIFTLYHFTKNE